MQKNTKRSKYVGAMLSAAGFVLFLGIFLAILIVPLLIESLAYSVVSIILGVYTFMILAIIIGILLALRQRLKEIEGGEEDVASQY